MSHNKQQAKSSDDSSFHWANTVEGRERQLISLAYERVGEKMLKGTATSQELVFFLKLGTTREQIEREIKERERELITAKTEAIKSQKRVEDLYANAIKAFTSYQGREDEDYEELQ